MVKTTNISTNEAENKYLSITWYLHLARLFFSWNKEKLHSWSGVSALLLFTMQCRWVYHSGLKIGKIVQLKLVCLGDVARLPQGLKSTYFETFSSLTLQVPLETTPWKKIEKKTVHSVRKNWKKKQVDFLFS